MSLPDPVSHPFLIDTRSVAKGVLIAVLCFGFVGTLAALWDNPFFARMTPTGGFEITFLALQSLFIGTFFAIKTSGCATKTAGAGGLVGFIGIACPVCNKVLFFIFGAELLMGYLEPARHYLAALGAALTLAAVIWKYKSSRSFLILPATP